jgi:hypothetical protein
MVANGIEMEGSVKERINPTISNIRIYKGVFVPFRQANKWLFLAGLDELKVAFKKGAARNRVAKHGRLVV